MKTERNKIICDWYHSGATVSEISRRTNMQRGDVYNLLKTWYPRFYKTQFVGANSKEYYAELHKKYLEIYEPFVYRISEIARLCDCSIARLNKMFELYGIQHRRMQTYKHQKTLCNVPGEYYDEIKDYAKKYKFKSVRQLAVCALNEYMLVHEEDYLMKKWEEEYDSKD